MQNISISKGTKPILVMSIHHKEFGTIELNQELHRKKGYYSYIYYGSRETCIKEGQQHYLGLIDEMLAKYSQIGVISLHRRKPCRVVKKPTKRNYFELGTLLGQSLDESVKQTFEGMMGSERILFDDNIRFTGGQEIRQIHSRYNDSTYIKRQVNGHDPSTNKVQIVQLEINGPIPYCKKHYKVVSSLGMAMEFGLSVDRLSQSLDRISQQLYQYTTMRLKQLEAYPT